MAMCRVLKFSPVVCYKEHSVTRMKDGAGCMHPRPPHVGRRHEGGTRSGLAVSTGNPVLLTEIALRQASET